ncbi:MAG: hypothetical protein WCL71_09385 [Deltaproteobacteria bacterium]
MWHRRQHLARGLRGLQADHGHDGKADHADQRKEQEHGHRPYGIGDARVPGLPIAQLDVADRSGLRAAAVPVAFLIDGGLLIPYEFISVPQDANQHPETLTNIPAIDKSFFESLIDGNGNGDNDPAVMPDGGSGDLITDQIIAQIMFASQLSATTVDTCTIHLVNPANLAESRDVSLTETGPDTKVFHGSDVTVAVNEYTAFSPTEQDAVSLTLNDPTYGISNVSLVLWEKGASSLIFVTMNSQVGGNPLANTVTPEPYSPPDIPNAYKFKFRIAKGIATGETNTVTFQGLDSDNNELESIDVELEQDPNDSTQYVSKKAIVAVDGGVVSDAVRTAFPDCIFIDPPHFKVKQTMPDGSGTVITIADKTTTYVFPAVRWKTNGGSWSDLTDGYKAGSGDTLGTVHPEPTTGGVAFEYDTTVELFAIVRQYDAKQKKSRYFCGAADKPANITVAEGRTGSPKTFPLEAPNQAPESIKQEIKWYRVELSKAVADNTSSAETPINYRNTPITADSGLWSVPVGGDRNKGVARYKVAIGTAESLGAAARQNTQGNEDHHISDLVMRIIVKGNYPQDSSGYLSWISTMINVPFCDGARKNQVLNYVATDCAKTAQAGWLRLKNTTASYDSNLSANTIVKKAQNGTFLMVMPPTAIYPDSDTTPGHMHWTDMTRPQPGDLVMFDWPTMGPPRARKPQAGSFDHTTIFVGPAGGGHFAAAGADETIYASSAQDFSWSVKDKNYFNCYDAVQLAPSRQDNQTQSPVWIAIVRLQ